jgi:hypothetical protein
MFSFFSEYQARENWLPVTAPGLKMSWKLEKLRIWSWDTGGHREFSLLEYSICSPSNVTILRVLFICPQVFMSVWPSEDLVFSEMTLGGFPGLRDTTTGLRKCLLNGLRPHLKTAFLLFVGLGETELIWYVGHYMAYSTLSPVDRWWVWSSQWN